MKQYIQKLKHSWRAEKFLLVCFRREQSIFNFIARVHTISKKAYQQRDAKRVQYRILTPKTKIYSQHPLWKFPLANNLAERAIRPMVVTRKYLWRVTKQKRCKTHAINYECSPNYKMKNQPIIPTFKNHFLNALSNIWIVLKLLYILIVFVL